MYEGIIYIVKFVMICEGNILLKLLSYIYSLDLIISRVFNLKFS